MNDKVELPWTDEELHEILHVMLSELYKNLKEDGQI